MLAFPRHAWCWLISVAWPDGKTRIVVRLAAVEGERGHTAIPPPGCSHPARLPRSSFLQPAFHMAKRSAVCGKQAFRLGEAHFEEEASARQKVFVPVSWHAQAQTACARLFSIPSVKRALWRHTKDLAQAILSGFKVWLALLRQPAEIHRFMPHHRLSNC